MNMQSFRWLAAALLVPSAAMTFPHLERAMSETNSGAIASAIKDLKFDAQLQVSNSRLLVRYRVTNQTSTPLVLLNRGDSVFGLGEDKVYVEPKADGVVEISQRAFVEPTEGNGPDREMGILPGISRLAPGQSLSVELSVPLPLVRRSPYMDWKPASAVMPDPVRQVHFCLGVLKDEPPVRSFKKNGIEVMSNDSLIAQQQLLCTPVVALAELARP